MIFTFAEARELLPIVREITADAARHAETLVGALEDLPERDPKRTALDRELRTVVDDWAARIRAMGLEAKGLWLVDFDNGEGYYCWAHPETSLSHYHGYEDGFAGRVKIV